VAIAMKKVETNMKMKKTSVLIADDHMIMRQGLKCLLEAGEDIEVVGEACDGNAAVREAQRLQPEVVLMDIAMPLKNGIDAARRIKQLAPSTRILMLSTYGEKEEVQQAMDVGAVGYIIKESASAEILSAVRQAKAGKRFFSEPIARRMTQQTQRGRDADDSQELTPREMEVLKLIAGGRANKQIAAELGISIKTVEKHRQSLMNKLQIHEAASLTRYAIAHGMIECRRPSLVPGPEGDATGKAVLMADEEVREDQAI
jgi:DNA-binding NarL/FixJ family response regulator